MRNGKIKMVKFKVHVFTPYEEFYRTYFAKTKERAEALVKKWNEDFKRTKYYVMLLYVETTTEKLPKYYECW